MCAKIEQLACLETMIRIYVWKNVQVLTMEIPQETELVLNSVLIIILHNIQQLRVRQLMFVFALLSVIMDGQII